MNEPHTNGTMPAILPEARAAEKLEDWIPLNKISRKLPSSRHEKSICPSALHRWRLDGLKAADGSRVYLECRRIGGSWCSTWPRVEAFFDKLQRGREPVEQPKPQPQNSRLQSRAYLDACAKLDAAGIK